MAKKGFEPSRTRNFVMVGHRSAGKTSLSDVILQTAGVTRAIGRVDERTSLLDHTQEAHKRHMTMEPSTAWMSWRDHLLFLVDTPGSMDLAHVAEHAMHQLDGFVCVVAANDGVQHLTDRILHTANRLRVPGVAVINQMDRAFDLDGTVAELERASGRKAVLLQLPLMDDDGHVCGVVDLLDQKAYRYAPDGSGAWSEEPLSKQMARAAGAARERLIEAIALEDEHLLERYLEFLGLPDDVVQDGLARSTQRCTMLPVLLTSAHLAIGAGPLLDHLVRLLPEPSLARRPALDADGEFVATVLHTSIDSEGRPWSMLRVWDGAPRHGAELVTGSTGARSKVRKLFQVRGPRRAVAHSTGPGTIVGTWDLIDARPGDVLTHGARLSTPRPDMPPPMTAYTLSTEDDHQAALLERALTILLRMDHGLEVRALAGREHLLEGRTPGQLDRAVEWLKHRMGVRFSVELPRVAYREAPAQPASRAEGVHLRATNGSSRSTASAASTWCPPTRDGTCRSPRRWMVSRCRRASCRPSRRARCTRPRRDPPRAIRWWAWRSRAWTASTTSCSPPRSTSGRPGRRPCARPCSRAARACWSRGPGWRCTDLQTVWARSSRI